MSKRHKAEFEKERDELRQAFFELLAEVDRVKMVELRELGISVFDERVLTKAHAVKDQHENH